MTVNELLMCLHYVKDDFKVLEVKHNCVYFTFSSTMYDKQKLIDNYVYINNCESPKYYTELYSEKWF